MIRGVGITKSTAQHFLSNTQLVISATSALIHALMAHFTVIHAFMHAVINSAVHGMLQT